MSIYRFIRNVVVISGTYDLASAGVMFGIPGFSIFGKLRLGVLDETSYTTPMFRRYWGYMSAFMGITRLVCAYGMFASPHLNYLAFLSYMFESTFYATETLVYEKMDMEKGLIATLLSLSCACLLI